MKFPINKFFCGFFATPFITKAEFDSLKNNFQSQIDQYNSSIDSKIDGAIAAYLAGIKLETMSKLTSLVNKCGAIKFVKDFNHFGTVSTSIGTWYDATLFFICIVRPITSGTIGRGGRISSGITSAGNAVTKTYNENDPSYFLEYTESSIMNSARVNPVGIIKSKAVGSWVGVGYNNSPKDNTDRYYMSTFSWESSLTDFGTEQKTASANLGGVSNISISGPYTISTVDTNLATDFNFVAGGAITDFNIHSVKIDEMTKKGNKIATKNLSGEDVYAYTWSGANTQDMVNHTDALRTSNANRSLALYTHKYSNFGIEKIEQTTISNVLNKSITYYNGVPLCEINNNGKLKLKLKLGGTSEKADISINSDVFTNINLIRGIIGIDNSKIKIRNVTTNENSEWTTASDTSWTWYKDNTYELEFDVEKNKTYWIKVYPYDSTVTNGEYISYNQISSVGDIKLTVES